jgi:hypothetical protein
MHYTPRARIEEIIAEGVGHDLPTHMIADEILKIAVQEIEWFTNVDKFNAADVIEWLTRK